MPSFNNTGQQNHVNFCTGLKICYFEDFCLLNLIGTFIFACKLGKTAKIAVEVAKNAILGPSWTQLVQKGGKGRGSKINIIMEVFFLIG